MNKDEERRRILLLVADGSMTPGDAAERLAVLDEVDDDAEAASRDAAAADERAAAGRSGSTHRTTTSTSSSSSTRSSSSSRSSSSDRHTTGAGRGGTTTVDDDGPITSVRVVGSLRAVEIIGDPNVREAVADGPHVAFREGGVLIIETEPHDWHWGDEERIGFRFGGGGHRIRLRNYRAVQPPLQVRIQPDLPLAAEVRAGSLSILGVRGPITADVDAGSLRVRDFEGPLDVNVNAGSMSAHGTLSTGDSKIICNAGKVDLVLEADSDVIVHATCELGSVQLPGTMRVGGGFRTGAGRQEATVGRGTATLSLAVNLGAATVRLRDEDDS